MGPSRLRAVGPAANAIRLFRRAPALRVGLPRPVYFYRSRPYQRIRTSKIFRASQVLTLSERSESKGSPSDQYEWATQTALRLGPLGPSLRVRGARQSSRAKSRRPHQHPSPTRRRSHSYDIVPPAARRIAQARAAFARAWRENAGAISPGSADSRCRKFPMSADSRSDCQAKRKGQDLSWPFARRSGSRPNARAHRAACGS